MLIIMLIRDILKSQSRLVSRLDINLISDLILLPRLCERRNWGKENGYNLVHALENVSNGVGDKKLDPPGPWVVELLLSDFRHFTLM